MHGPGPTPSLAPLLDRLVGYLSGPGTAKTGFLIDREKLERIVDYVRLQYYGERHWAARDDRTADLVRAAPPDVTMQLLKREEVLAIAALAEGPEPAAMAQAEKRYQALLRDLAKVIDALPPITPRRRGKPSSTQGLRLVVEILAAYWETETGTRFGQYWRNGKPANPATSFVFDILQFIAPDRLGQLPEVTEKLVADRCPSLSSGNSGN